MKYKITYTMKPYEIVIDKNTYDDDMSLEDIQEYEKENASENLLNGVDKGDVSVDVKVEEVLS